MFNRYKYWDANKAYNEYISEEDIDNNRIKKTKIKQPEI